MAELPVISGDQCIRALERIGYRVARTKGSHVRMRCPGRRPVILRTAGSSVEEFIELL